MNERLGPPEDNNNRDEAWFYGPPREQLAAGEIDMTGVVPQPDDLRYVIGDAITEAEASGGEVSEWGARAMARQLANFQATLTSALHHFAVTGRADLPRMRDELAELWVVPHLSEHLKTCINWLGTYLVAIGRDPRQPKGPEFKDALLEATRLHDLAFAAFLTLPDINETNAADLFATLFVGAYDTVQMLVDDVIQMLGLRQRLTTAMVDHIGEIDPAKVLNLARQTWHVVEHEGRFYLFEI